MTEETSTITVVDCDTWTMLVERLYRQHFDQLCWNARRLLDTRHAAEEAVQEAFMRLSLLNKRPAAGSELAYLRAIVMNEARSTLRRRRTQHRYRHHFVPDREIDSTWRDAAQTSEVEQINEVLATLTHRQREVVTLRHLVGLSERETALTLGISAGSVKTHCSRGLSMIRGTMGSAA